MSRNDFYRAVGGLAAIAASVIAIVGIPASARPYVLALTTVIALVWRRVERAPLRDPVQGLAVVGLIAAAAWIIVGAVGDGDDGNRSAPDPQHEASPGKVLRIYNKVTSGPERMREDDEPVSLVMKAAAYCGVGNCQVPDTNRETGDTYDAAVCQRQGEEVTNGQDTSPIDDDNPGLFSSRLYYGVRLDDDTFGYVSEAWISPEDRGGLSLPRC